MKVEKIIISYEYVKTYIPQGQTGIVLCRPGEGRRCKKKIFNRVFLPGRAIRHWNYFLKESRGRQFLQTFNNSLGKELGNIKKQPVLAGN